MGAANDGAIGIDATDPLVEKTAGSNLIEGYLLSMHPGPFHLAHYGKELDGKDRQDNATSITTPMAGYVSTVHGHEPICFAINPLTQIHIVLQGVRVHMSRSICAFRHSVRLRSATKKAFFADS